MRITTQRYNRGGLYKLMEGLNNFKRGGRYVHGGVHPGNPKKPLTPEQEALALAMERRSESSVSGSSGAIGDEGRGYTTPIESVAQRVKAPFLGDGEPEPEASPARPANMKPIKSRGPKTIDQDLARKIIGSNTKETPRGGSSVEPIMFEPTTSNIRAYTRKDSKNPDAGYRTLGGEKDAFAQGFRIDGKAMYATPEVFDLMKKEGINAKDPYAIEFMRELAEKNPELFTENQNRGAINSMVMSEVHKDPTERGFFLQADQPVIKASF